jgi:uncharacterized protein YfaS (alpha-2-macroglobulin family)
MIPSSIFANKIPLTSIQKIVQNNTKNTIVVCARMKNYSYENSTKAIKPYIKVTPRHTFTTAWSYDELCVKGLHPRTKYQFEFYKNMPLGKLKLDKNYSFSATTTDYKADFNFPDNGYILPTKSEISIPIETTNVNALRVSLYRINHRNLISSINKFSLLRSLSRYELNDIEEDDGYLLWKKKLNLGHIEANIAKTTAIPVGDFLKEKKSGVYILHVTMLDEKGEEIYDYAAKTQWFMLSDIGLYTLKSKEGLEVLTKTLSTAKNYEGVKLELIAKNNEVLDTVVSANGHAFFSANVLRGKKGLQAKAIYAYGGKNDFTVINLSKPAHDLSDRGVIGRKSSGVFDAFIYSNRDIFKPGEALTFHTLLRDTLGKAKPHTTVLAKVFDAREVTVYTKRFTSDNLGHFSDTVAIPQSAKTGKWRLALYAGSDKELAHYSFSVEDFVPPKIKISLNDIPETIKSNEITNMYLNVQYLNGEPLAHANIEINTIIKKAKNPFKAYLDYQFGDIKEHFSNEQMNLVTATTDTKGAVVIPFQVKASYASMDTRIHNSTLPLSLHIDITANELGGRAVHKIVTPYFETRHTHIGIKANFPNHAVDMGDNAKFGIIYLNDEQLSPQSLHYEIVKEETRWHWRSKGESWEYYRTYSDSEVLLQGKLSTSASKPIELSLKKLDWGSYRLVLKDTHKTLSSYRFSSGYEESSSKSSPDRLPLSIDKQSYHEGDTLQVHIVPKFTGPIEVYIAHDTLIAHKMVQGIAGKGMDISFVVSSAWGSSAYVLATAFRAQSKKLGANRAVGLSAIHIKHPEQELHLTLKHPHKSSSHKSLKVTIVSKEAAGKQTHMTLAAVDEGVLNITAYTLPDPRAYFLGQRQLGIEIRDIYADLIKARGAHAKFDVGAGDMEAPLVIKDLIKNHHEVVAFFSDVVTFNKEGIAEITVDIPDYQGALKLMAIAWNANAIGSTESSIIVKDSISPEFYRPQFMSVGDKVETLLTLSFDKTLASGLYHVTIAPQDNLDFNVSSFDVSIEKGENLTVKKKILSEALSQGTANIHMKITKDNTLVKEKIWKLAIRTTYPQTYVRKMGIIKKGDFFSKTNHIGTKAWTEIQNLSLSISNKALIAQASLESELIEYAGRCAEQTTSRAMPWLFSATQTQEKKILIQDAIERLLNYQKIDGGFSLWASTDTHMWLSAYVLDFLTRAKKAGYAVPKHNIKMGLNWLENHLSRWNENSQKQESDAYALYVLARAGRTLMSEINYHTNNKKSKITSAQAWGHLAATLAYVGETKKAKQLFHKAQASLHSAHTNHYYSNYGGALRDEASLISLMYESKLDDTWQNLFADLALSVKKRDYFSTQELSTLLRASKLMDNQEAKDLVLAINTQTKTFIKRAYTVDADSLAKIPKIKNLSDQDSWYDLSFKATPNASYYTQAHNYGFSIFKTIYTLKGEKVDLAHIAPNQRLVVVLEGTMHQAGIEHPLVTDWTVAGLELENPHLIGIDTTSTLTWLGKQTPIIHAAYRTDRFEAAIKSDKKGHFKIAYIVRAVSKGTFSLAPAKIEDMYQPRYRAFSTFDNALVHIKTPRTQVKPPLSH